MKIFLLLVCLIILIYPSPVQAFYDPLSVPNNKYGIHIADFNDLPNLPLLINSSGGDWGYVTLVATDNDRDSGKWQELFNKMRRYHIIPLVRLATHPVKDFWAKPDPSKFKEIVSFFNALNWPTANRYLILYNEPNHAKEWGGNIDPEEYAGNFIELAKDFKAASKDFFIMPAGLDVSADGEIGSVDAGVYWQAMAKAKPEIFDLMDGLASHSYPNPGFSGSPYALGRGTLRSYQWELSLLAGLGLKKQLPVFITETGWEHASGKNFNPSFLSDTQVAQNFLVAANGVWSDPQIVAVTPFVFNYQDEPFDHFSWQNFKAFDYYNQYYIYQGLPKVSGQPIQHEIFTFEPDILPKSLVAGSTYNLTSVIENKGQSILNTNDYKLTIDDPKKVFENLLSDPLPLVEPGEKGEISLHLKTKAKPGIYPVEMNFVHYGRMISLLKENLVLVPPPSLTIKAQLGWKKTGSASGVKVLIYDLKDNLIEKFVDQKMENGVINVSGLTDIVPGMKYRVVVIAPYYLPRQTIAVLNKDVTTLGPKRLLPLDFDGDGALTLRDIVALLKTDPNTVIGRFFSL